MPYGACVGCEYVLDKFRSGMSYNVGMSLM